MDPGGEGRQWLRKQKEDQQVPILALQSAGAPTCRPFQVISGYSHLCNDLIAFLVVRRHATANSDYLRQLEEMDTDTEFHLKSFSCAAAQDSF